MIETEADTRANRIDPALRDAGSNLQTAMGRGSKRQLDATMDSNWTLP